MTPKQIGALLRKARGQRGQREIAALAGLTPGQVSAIERGATAYTVPSLLALCKAVFFIENNGEEADHMVHRWE